MLQSSFHSVLTSTSRRIIVCCDGWDYTEEAKEIGECPDCGEEVDEDGDALTGCNYSSVICETCGAAPCDGSC
jgi:hypothetical protein